MSVAEADFERVLQHCVEITSSLDTRDVVAASVAAMDDLLPGTDATLRLEEDGAGIPLSTEVSRDPGVRFETLLSVGGKVMGKLSVHSSRSQPFSAAERALVLAITPAIASALNNAMVVERERATWRRRRDLEAQKALFVKRAASDLKAPLNEMRGLVVALSGPEREEAARELHLSARRLARVVEQVLDQSAPESGAD